MILYMTNLSGFQAALMAAKGVGRSKITTLSLALRPKPVPTRQHSWKMPIEMQIQWVAVELWQHIVRGHESTTNHGIEKTFHFWFFVLALILFIGCGSNSRSNEPTAICASSAPSHAGASSASIVGMHKAYSICTLVEKVCLYFWQLQFLWCCVGLGPTVDADGVAHGCSWFLSLHWQLGWCGQVSPRQISALGRNDEERVRETRLSRPKLVLRILRVMMFTTGFRIAVW